MEQRRIELEPLLCFLELKVKGTWESFRTALGAIVPAPHSAFEVADRLAAQGFLEVDWRDGRSWEVCGPVLVEGTRYREAFDGEQARMAETSTTAPWSLFGASSAMTSYLLSGLPSSSYRTQDVTLDVGKGVRLDFKRAVLLETPTASAVASRQHVPTLSSHELQDILALLPDMANVAIHWKEESEKNEADFVRLEEAYEIERFRADLGSWEPRSFDGALGLWRAEGKPRRYFFVVPPYEAASASTVSRSYDYFQVPRDLGAWFAVLAQGPAGTAKISKDSRTLEIVLAPGIIDLPVLYERWLALRGCRRFVLRQWPKTLRYTNVDAAQAATLARRLHLKREP